LTCTSTFSEVAKSSTFDNTANNTTRDSWLVIVLLELDFVQLPHYIDVLVSQTYLMSYLIAEMHQMWFWPRLCVSPYLSLRVPSAPDGFRFWGLIWGHYLAEAGKGDKDKSIPAFFTQTDTNAQCSLWYLCKDL